MPIRVVPPIRVEHARDGSAQLIFQYEDGPGQGAPQILHRFEQDQQLVRNGIGGITFEIEQQRRIVRESIEPHIAMHKAELQQRAAAEASLGIPLREGT
jgi:hypothetical protein